MSTKVYYFDSNWVHQVAVARLNIDARAAILCSHLETSFIAAVRALFRAIGLLNCITVIDLDRKNHGLWLCAHQQYPPTWKIRFQIVWLGINSIADTRSPRERTPKNSVPFSLSSMKGITHDFPDSDSMPLDSSFSRLLNDYKLVLLN